MSDSSIISGILFLITLLLEFTATVNIIRGFLLSPRKPNEFKNTFFFVYFFVFVTDLPNIVFIVIPTIITVEDLHSLFNAGEVYNNFVLLFHGLILLYLSVNRLLFSFAFHITKFLFIVNLMIISICAIVGAIGAVFFPAFVFDDGYIYVIFGITGGLLILTLWKSACCTAEADTKELAAEKRLFWVQLYWVIVQLLFYGITSAVAHKK